MIPKTFLWVAVLLIESNGVFAASGKQRQENAQGPSYTVAEYNEYMNAAQNKNPQQRIGALDNFVVRYPHSDLLPFAYETYYGTYGELKRYAKEIEFADKYLATAKTVGPAARLRALAARTRGFELLYRESDPGAEAQLKTARAAAVEAIELLDTIPKPANVPDEQFAHEKKTTRAFYEYAGGYAALELKNYAEAVRRLAFASGVNDQDPVTFLELGIAKLKLDPPDTIGGFWALARSLALKLPNEAPTRAYLRDQVQRFQMVSCDNLVDDEVNKMIALAGASAAPTPGYALPSAADLQKIRENAGPILDDLRPADEHARQVWLAVCGLEFPEVGVRVLDVSSTESAVVLHAFRAPTVEAMQAATEPNMEITVAGQPEAARLKTDDWVRFQGTLVGYQASPFLLTWDKASINSADIPRETPKKRKARSRRPA